MATLIFSASDALARLAHAKSCSAFTSPYGQKVTTPGLLLVKDHGVYLMSAGLPRETRTDKPESSIVVYAQGCHPEKDEDWYEVARAAVGGDDFVEFLANEQVEPLLQAALAQNGDFIIEITDEHISLGFQPKS